ncbi:lycopene cyclase domain-containing protein [Microbacterium sediminicola]|uniref:Lycopene cyclase domain-containing protein n=1 Tax=Microbacterium sediminicola TaxID=415210 RepID=A0ABP4TMG4_9MICO
MPGTYLAAILLSMLGVGIIDARWRLALFGAPVRTLVCVGIGVVFFLVWDAVGILTRSFAKGDSPLFTGIDLAPELPLEEPVFLAFLCYLALVAFAGVVRWSAARATADAQNTDSVGDAQ